MKKMALIIILLGLIVLPSYGEMTGYIYLGGGFDRTVTSEIDGIEITDDTGYGEGTLSMTWNRQTGFYGVYALVNRDDFYYEMTGKLSFGQYDTFMGNINSYVSYSDLDDITESDNDSGKMTFYFQTVKYISDTSYMGSDISWDHVDYADESLGLYDYDDYSVSLNGGFGDIFATLKSTMREISGGETPGYKEFSGDIFGYFYPGDMIFNVSAGSDYKDYDFSSDDYDDYLQNNIAVKAGKKLSEYFVPYIIGEMTLYNESENPGNYIKWEAGLELEMFKYPLSFMAKTGRKNFKEDSASRLSYTFFIAEGSWNFWTGPVSFYMGDSWELQKIDDVTSTDFPEAKNSNFINSLYMETVVNISRAFAAITEVGYEWKEYFIEDEMNADYKQFSAQLSLDYNLYYKYMLNITGEYSNTRYDTFTENDSTDYRLTSTVQYSF